MMATDKSSWIALPQGARGGHQRLFCFPYAGGGAATYFPWRPLLERYGISVCCVQLPGREGRIKERCIGSMADLVSLLCSAIERYTDQPFAFFGHSMGAVIAFEVTRELARRGSPLPQWLLASGALPPDRRDSKSLHLLPRDQFLDALANRYGGLPPEVLAHAELLDLIVPVLYADFGLIERYSYQAAPPLAVKIAAFGGQDDEWAPVADLEGWREQTTRPGDFQLAGFEGQHFFLNTRRTELVAAIARLLLQHEVI